MDMVITMSFHDVWKGLDNAIAAASARKDVVMNARSNKHRSSIASKSSAHGMLPGEYSSSRGSRNSYTAAERGYRLTVSSSPGMTETLSGPSGEALAGAKVEKSRSGPPGGGGWRNSNPELVISHQRSELSTSTAHLVNPSRPSSDSNGDFGAEEFISSTDLAFASPCLPSLEEESPEEGRGYSLGQNGRNPHTSHTNSPRLRDNETEPVRPHSFYLRETMGI